jgi:hypothetical protein
MTLPRSTRRRLAGCALLALAALAGGVWWLAAPGRVTKANFDRILSPRIGGLPNQGRDGGRMTYNEVVAILGPPEQNRFCLPEDRPHEYVCFWNSFYYCVTVDFDRDGVTYSKYCSHRSLGQALYSAWYNMLARLKL